MKMKSYLRNYAVSALLALPAAVALVALPTSAMAQPSTPEVRSLQIAGDAGFLAGSRMRFTVEGTPHAQGEVRVRGLRDRITLREVSRGVYVGYYTIKRTDRVAADAEVRVALRNGNRSSVASYGLNEALEQPRVVVAPPPPPVPVLPPLRIERFGMMPIERIEPGAELQFALEGQPGSTVSVDLPGVEGDLRLSETRPGHYEGRYTLRRADNINPNRPFVATLRSGDRVVTSNLNLVVGRPGGDNRGDNRAENRGDYRGDHGDNRADNRGGSDNRPPSLVNMSPRDGETVAGGPPVQIAANFDDHGGGGVEPETVQIMVSGRNVTREAQINRQSFVFRGVLPPGRHTVDVTARDRAGNAVRQGWSFDVVVNQR